jgi:hypothetical protein
LSGLVPRTIDANNPGFRHKILPSVARQENGLEALSFLENFSTRETSRGEKWQDQTNREMPGSFRRGCGLQRMNL